jgi:hypothetical protein
MSTQRLRVCSVLCATTLVAVTSFATTLAGSAEAADIEYWIQLENNPWDMSPRNVDRMAGNLTGATPAPMIFHARDGSITYTIQGFNPLTLAPGQAADALILRRYKPPSKPDKTDAWTIPDDRKVNPWDLNERDPRDRDNAGARVTGTSGTIPGATIECNVGDSVIVHFRNKDTRTHVLDPTPITPDKLVHSLHTHGFVFAQEFDGAYPLSQLDKNQPINTADVPIWSTVPGGIEQFRDATTHNLFKRGDRVPSGGTFDYKWVTLGWPTTAGVWIYHDHSIADTENVKLGAIGFVVIHNPNDPNDVQSGSTDLPGGSFTGSPIPKPDDPPKGQKVIQPPSQAQYLLLFHDLGGFTCINGRVFLGNTPTLVAGEKTKMRFGVAGMGKSNNGFHTFHLHGHRWVIPGPDGNKNAAGGGIGDPNSIQNSALVRAVSQFEDTKVFGPANSFAFTILEDAGQGSFMRAEPALGEWHMHCHVLDHMTSGMMGSLLVVQKDQVLDLPHGGLNPDMVKMRLKLLQNMRALEH